MSRSFQNWCEEANSRGFRRYYEEANRTRCIRR